MPPSNTGRITELHPSQFNSGPNQFSSGGGYGFIEADDLERLYFNPSGLQLSSVQFEFLKVGDRCRFTAIDHPEGPRAIEVFVSDPGQRGLPL